MLVLGASAIGMLAWGMALLVNGIPSGNFSWTIGLFTAFVVYGIFLVTRYVLPGRARSRPLVNLAPLFALVVAGVIDVGVFFRAAETLLSSIRG